MPRRWRGPARSSSSTAAAVRSRLRSGSSVPVRCAAASCAGGGALLLRLVNQRTGRRGIPGSGSGPRIAGQCRLSVGGHVGTLFRASTCRRQKNARVPPDARSRTVCSRRVVYDMLTHRLHVVVQTRSDSSFASSHSRYMRLALLANATLVQRTWSKTWKKEAHGQVGGPHD